MIFSNSLNLLSNQSSGGSQPGSTCLPPSTGMPKGDTDECHFLERNSLMSNDLRSEYGLYLYVSSNIYIRSSVMISFKLRGFPSIYV
jgi:hypothetical protein